MQFRSFPETFIKSPRDGPGTKRSKLGLRMVDSESERSLTSEGMIISWIILI